MPHYMIEASYRPEQIQAMVAQPQDRVEAVRKLFAAVGGEMECCYFAFGDSDILAIGTFPDNEAALAAAMLVGDGGAAASYKTTVLLTAQEAMEGMKRAGASKGQYRPATG